MIEGKRRAVIIGINQYRDERIQSLTGAENDARDLFERLKDTNIGNFEIPEHHCLIGAAATSERIRKAISDVFWQTDGSDLALFYFSGHGFVDGYNDGYIAPFDFCEDEPSVCGANMSDLKRMVSRSNNRSAILILDCCYSGITTKGDKGGMTDFRAKYEATLEGFASEGRIIFASSTPDQLSRETTVELRDGTRRSHGMFTHHLLDALDGAASDEQGIISILLLQEYLQKQFPGDTGQTPRFYTEGSNLNAIKLAIATEKYYENIKAKIDEARRCLDQKSFASLLHATRKILEVLEINSKQKEAFELKDKIGTTLSEQKALMETWLTNNELDVRPSLEYVFPEFDNLVVRLRFDEIPKLPDRDLKLLNLLSRVTIEELDRNQFIVKCKAFDKPESRPQPISDPANRPAK